MFLSTVLILSVGGAEYSPPTMPVPAAQSVLLSLPSSYPTAADGWVCANGVCRRVSASATSSVSIPAAMPTAAGVPTMDVPTGCDSALGSATVAVTAGVRFRPLRRLFAAFQNRPRLFGRSAGGCGCQQQ